MPPAYHTRWFASRQPPRMSAVLVSRKPQAAYKYLTNLALFSLGIYIVPLETKQQTAGHHE